MEYNHTTKDIEIQWITINNPNMKKLVLANLYRPPQGNIENCCVKIESLFNDVIGKYQYEPEIIIIRDFNIDYRDHHNINTRRLKWFEQYTGLKQHITDITRYSDKDSTIDLMFSNCVCISSSRTLDLNLSDHQAVYITRKHIPKPREKCCFKGRSYLNLNENNVITKLLEYDWNPLYDMNDVDIAWQFILNIITETIDTFCPIKTFSIKKTKDPLITQEILEAMNDRDKLLRKAKKSNELLD